MSSLPPTDIYKVGDKYKTPTGPLTITAIGKEFMLALDHYGHEAKYLIPHTPYPAWILIREDPIEPDPPEDKLYPVEVRTSGIGGVFVVLPGTRIGAGHAIGRPDGEGRVCIGFSNGMPGVLNDHPIYRPGSWTHRWQRSLYKYAIFRHHSLIDLNTE